MIFSNNHSLFRLISDAPAQSMAEYGDTDGTLLRNLLFDQWEMDFETTVPALAAMCLEMERAVLRHDATGGEVFVGFQRLSRFTPTVAGRYARMAEAGNQIYIFGVPDSQPDTTHPNIHYIPLDTDDALVEEWFLIIDTPQYAASLSALDLVGFDQIEKLEERLFTGVRSNSAKISRSMAAMVRSMLEGEGLLRS